MSTFATHAGVKASEGEQGADGENPSVVFNGFKSVHEDYVDWDHMKRQTMLTALLSSYKDMIDETRVLLEAAAVEKKKRSEEKKRKIIDHCWH